MPQDARIGPIGRSANFRAIEEPDSSYTEKAFYPDEALRTRPPQDLLDRTNRPIGSYVSYAQGANAALKNEVDFLIQCLEGKGMLGADFQKKLDSWLTANAFDSVEGGEFGGRPYRTSVRLTELVKMLRSIVLPGGKEAHPLVKTPEDLPDFSSIRNFVVAEDGVMWRGNQPNEAGLKWLKEMSLREHGTTPTIVNLRSENNEEAEICKRLGIDSKYISIDDDTAPTMDQIQEFLDIMNEPKNHPVYVHCMAGMGRTGIMCAAYQISQGMSFEKALQVGADYGFEQPEQIVLLKKFVEERMGIKVDMPTGQGMSPLQARTVANSYEATAKYLADNQQDANRQSVTLLRGAVELEPTNPQRHFDLAKEHHRRGEMTSATTSYMKVFDLQPAQELSADDKALAQQLMPRIKTNAQEPFALKDVVVIKHPTEPLFAYNLIWENDGDQPDNNMPGDREMVWVKYDPTSKDVTDIYTLFDNTVFKAGADAVADANAHGGRPEIQVQWAKHGSLPKGWEQNMSAAQVEDTLGYPKYSSVGLRMANHPAASKWPDKFPGSADEFKTFNGEVDALSLAAKGEHFLSSEFPSAAINLWLPYAIPDAIDWPGEAKHFQDLGLKS